MKVQCDVCNKNEASVFCSADEAALCDGCDQSVHFANKLASKHHRFSLLQPSSCQFPICDICQEKRALLFCQQDRAILCRDCDIPLHTSNEFTQKHNRFLLTGAQLSATISSDKTNHVPVPVSVSVSVSVSVPVPVADLCDTAVPDHFKTVLTKPTSVLSEIPPTTMTTRSVVANNSSNSKSNSTSVNSVKDDHHHHQNQLISGGSTISTNIEVSDYLIDTLPGWHFDDFILDPPASTNTTPFGFCKSGNNNCNYSEDMLSFINVENEKKFTSYQSTHQPENLWVPQAPPTAATIVFDQPSMFSQNTSNLVGHGTKHQQDASDKLHRKNWRSDDAFTVPQITAAVGSKRNRSFW